MERSGGILSRFAPLLLALAVLVAAATPCVGAPEQSREGFRLLVDDDAVIEKGESVGAVIVADGNLEVQGDVDFVLVINGSVHVADAQVGDLVVVNGQADIGANAVITGNVQLVQSVLLRDPEASIANVRNDTSFAFGAGLGALGLIFGIGYSLALMIAVTIFAAVMPRLARDAGVMMTHEMAKTALGALALWIVIPLLAALMVATIVGIPFAIGTLLFLLPTLAFIGYLVAAVRLGDSILQRFRTREPDDHPYAEGLLGMLVLVLMSWIPGLGGVVTFLAFLGGSGALALAGWRAMRSHEEPTPQMPAGFPGMAGTN